MDDAATAFAVLALVRSTGEPKAAPAVKLVRTPYPAAVTTRRGWISPVTDAHLPNIPGTHEHVSLTATASISLLTTP
jgi:hypothetical protein